VKAVRTTVAKNATTAKTAPRASASKTTSKAAAGSAAARRGTGKSAEPDPAPSPASPAARPARGTGAGAKAATGRSTRTSTTRSRATGSAGRGRAPAHTATAVVDRTDVPPVPPGTDWTSDELAEVRGDLERELADLRADYDRALADITTLRQSSNDGAGDDQADAGSKTFEREQEMSIANNRRDLLIQMERAMERLAAGTYGRCESCGEPIPKARLQAFPSATLCVRCKQREERR
jgi:RNA polymerase-binding transcription factor